MSKLIDQFSEEELRQIAIELEERKKETTAKNRKAVRDLLILELSPLVTKVAGTTFVKGHEELQYVRFDKSTASAIISICNAVFKNTQTKRERCPGEREYRGIDVAKENTSLPAQMYDDYLEFARELSAMILQKYKQTWGSAK